MCILDQEEKQLKSLQKAEKIFGDIYRQIIQNKSDNYTSIKFYNILGAIVVDSLRKMYIITDTLGGSIEIANKRFPLYLKSALSEFAPAQIDLGTVLIDYRNGYTKAFPLQTNITQTTVQGTDSQGNLVTNITRNTQQSRLSIELSKPEVIEKSIKNTSIYNALVPEVKAAFDQEFTRFIKSFNKNVATVDVPFTTMDPKNYSWYKIDINKAVDFNTGILLTPIPFVVGYPYTYTY
jgi:hypothetical protein